MGKHRRKHVKLLNGVKLRKPLFYRICLGTTFFCLAITGLVYFGFSIEKKSSRISDTVNAGAVSARNNASAGEKTAKDDPPKLSAIEELLLLHGQASGLSEIESLALTGSYESFGHKFELGIFGKKPGLFRQSLTINGLEIIAAFDGKRYWQDNPFSESYEKEAPGLEQWNDQILLLECAYAALVWQYEMFGVQKLSIIEEKDIGGRQCHGIRNLGLLHSPVVHYIDVESGLELRRSSLLDNGVSQIHVTLDYKYIDNAVHHSGLRNLSGYDLYLDDALIAQATIKSQRVNQGVMSWMFEKDKAGHSAENLIRH